MKNIAFLQKFNPQKKLIFFGLFLILILAITTILIYTLCYNVLIYTNQNLNFYIHEDKYIVYADTFAGEYKYSGESNMLILNTPLLKNPPQNIDYDIKDGTILKKNFSHFKKYNFNLSLHSIFKIDFLNSDIENITEIIKNVPKYNNVSWTTVNVYGETRKCARIVDGVETPLLKVYFSKDGKMESIVVDYNAKTSKFIKKYLRINRIKSLAFIESESENSIFFMTDGTVSVIKNKGTLKIDKIEIRKYGSSGHLFAEGFLTDIETQKTTLDNDL